MAILLGAELNAETERAQQLHRGVPERGNPDGRGARALVRLKGDEMLKSSRRDKAEGTLDRDRRPGARDGVQGDRQADDARQGQGRARAAATARSTKGAERRQSLTPGSVDGYRAPVRDGRPAVRGQARVEVGRVVGSGRSRRAADAARRAARGPAR